MSAYRRLILPVTLLAMLLAVVSDPAAAQIGSPSGAVGEIVRVSAELQVQNETTGRLIVTAKIADGYHIYAQSQPMPFLASKISVTESSHFRIADSFRPDTTPLVHRHEALDVELHEFERVVNWSAPVELTRGVDPTSLNVTGTVFAQACNADRCLAPKTYAFTASVRNETAVSDGRQTVEQPGVPRSGDRGYENAALLPSVESRPLQIPAPVEIVEPMDLAAPLEVAATAEAVSSPELDDQPADSAQTFSLANVRAPSESAVSGSLIIILPLAFLAGFLLNFMPCVLPVVGLKVLSFVQQAGDSRRKVFLLNVAYLMSFMPIPSVVPTSLLLLGIGVACWRLGTVVVMGTRGQKLKAWADASLVTAVAAAIAFGWLQGVMAERFERAAVRVAGVTSPAAAVQPVSTSETTPDEIAWEPFSRQRLEQLVAEGRTVFVDFTADWCLTCKSNEAVAIETPEVRELLHSRGIVALRADKTKPASEVDATLRLLGNLAASILFYAVFPAKSPERPITLDGVFASPQPIVDALTRAEGSGSSAVLTQASSNGLGATPHGG